MDLRKTQVVESARCGMDSCGVWNGNCVTNETRPVKIALPTFETDSKPMTREEYTVRGVNGVVAWKLYQDTVLK